MTNLITRDLIFSALPTCPARRPDRRVRYWVLHEGKECCVTTLVRHATDTDSKTGSLIVSKVARRLADLGFEVRQQA